MRKAQSETADDDDKLAYFKKKLLAHLDKLAEKEAGPIKKCLAWIINKAGKSGRGLPVGSVREWKGKKFIKTPSGKWKRKYESEEGRGIKLSLAAIRRVVDKAQTSDDLMKIALDNRDRFSDANGNPPPIVQELSAYVSKRGDYLINSRAKREAVRETERQKRLDSFLLRRQGAEKTETVKDSDVESSPVPEITKRYLSYRFVTGNNDDSWALGMDNPVVVTQRGGYIRQQPDYERQTGGQERHG